MRTTLLALLLVLAAAPAAQAATRYATPLPAMDADCSQAEPCGIVAAVNNAGDNDEVILLPGTYGATIPIGTGLQVDNTGLNVHGQAGQPMPVFRTNAATGATVTDGTLSRLEIRHIGSTEALRKIGGSAHGIVASSPGQAACFVAGALTDSVCLNTRTGSTGVGVNTETSGGGVTSLINNVTAIATGSQGIGVRARASGGAGTVAGLRAFNTIARGGLWDAQADASAGTDATVDFDHSNFRPSAASEAGTGDANVLSLSGQSAAPLFVNPAAGDYHQRTGSPTINAGDDDQFNGTTDLDGGARKVGPAVDIGADEYVPPPAQKPQPKPAEPKPAVLPSNVFRFGRFKAFPKRGTGELRLRVPGAGRLTVSDARPASASQKKRRRPKALVKTARKRPKKAGVVRVTIKPNKRGKRRLKRRGRLRVTLRVSFRPTGGKAHNRTKVVRLKLAR